MFDWLVADGARTTTGGVVIARSSHYDEDGRMYARKENHATCGHCEGGWPIYGTVTDWMDNGFPMVKDGDRVLCPCGKNTVIASRSSTALISGGESETITKASHQIVMGFGHQFVLCSVSSRQPLSGVPYRALDGDVVVATGTTDDDGRTARISMHAVGRIVIQIGESEGETS